MASSSAASAVRRAGRRHASAVVAAVALLCALAAPAAALPVDPAWAPPPTVFIPETGQTIDRLFLDLWRSGGGAFAFGLPITPEITEPDGHVVQYYEYARFEYWPRGDAAGNVVALGRIGAELRPPTIPRRPVTGGRGFLRNTGAAADVAIEQRAWTPYASEQDVDLDGDPERRATYRFVPESGHGVWGGFRAFWEATGEAAYLGNPLSEEYAAGGTSFQVFERGKLRWRPGEEVRMVPVGEMLVERYGLPTKREQRGKTPVYDEALFVPPVATPESKGAPPPPTGTGRSVVVSLGRQALWAYEGRRVVMSTFVSTGTEQFKTPPGLFSVNTKLEAQTMEGVIGGEYYNVPGVPYVMYFTDQGHALHGTYWHENFGAPMSHGCVNLPMDVAEWMYGWAPMGLPVLVVE